MKKKINIQEVLIRQFNEQKAKYLRLNQSTKNLILLLIAAAAFSFFLNKIYKPQQQKVYRLEQDLSSLENKLFKSKGALPDIAREENLLKEENKSLEALEKQIDVLEAQLPQQDSLSNLLGRLVKQSEGYNLDFKLIKPIEDEEEKAYDRLNIEMRFSSDFNSVLNYLRRLESIFEFLKTDKVLVKRDDDLNKDGLEITMYLSTLLSDSTDVELFRTKVNLVEQLSERLPEENPYNPQILTDIVEEDEEIPLYLTGVILQGKNPSAIINDDVYVVGDTINNYIVSKISREGVLLLKDEEPIFIVIEDEPEKDQE